MNEGNVPKSRQDPNYREARRAFLVGYDRSVPRLRQASHCIGCNQCVSHCPQSIKIPQQLRRIDRFVEQAQAGRRFEVGRLRSVAAERPPENTSPPGIREGFFVCGPAGALMGRDFRASGVRRGGRAGDFYQMLIFTRGKPLSLSPKRKPMKDSIDFARMNIPQLFRKLLIPTVLGMVFSVAFVITDGVFVGHGIGSDALAAVNITAPLFLISTGIGLMFGVGASVVASIHLSHGKVKTARINITQAVVVSTLLLALYSLAVTLFAPEVARLLGSSDRLLPLAVEYMRWFVPFLPFSALLSSGMFFIRLDGSPNYAMFCNAVPAVINIILDYVFIFICGWGMTGAALATSLGYIVGAAMIVVYLSRRRHVVRFCRVKTSRKVCASPAEMSDTCVGSDFRAFSARRPSPR